MTRGKDRFLIYGARAGSLGGTLALLLRREVGMNVVTAGISGDEDETVDILDEEKVLHLLVEHKPTTVVCTVGINEPDTPFDAGFNDSFSDMIAINTFGPLNLLKMWTFTPGCVVEGSQFVVVSSNSAHVARSKAASYCMSKAALSMGIRCAAREFAVANPGDHASIYGWEFGALAGTPMTDAVRARLGEIPLSRIPGLPDGIPVLSAAQAMMGALMMEGHGLNGSLLRLDGGEQ